jgi:competence protein ComGC
MMVMLAKLKSRNFLICIVIAVVVFALVLVLSIVRGSGQLESNQKRQVVSFYSSFIEEATSLDKDKINTAYSDLKAEGFEGQSTNAVRDKIFARFSEVDPDLFSKFAVEYATYDDVGTAYSNVLLMSLATGGKGIEPVLPTDAVTIKQDDELNRTVYEIDRSKITAPVPLLAQSLVTKVDLDDIPPIKIIKSGSDWKIIPDSSFLNEIGIPNEGK